MHHVSTTLCTVLIVWSTVWARLVGCVSCWCPENILCWTTSGCSAYRRDCSTWCTALKAVLGYWFRSCICRRLLLNGHLVDIGSCLIVSSEVYVLLIRWLLFSSSFLLTCWAYIRRINIFLRFSRSWSRSVQTWLLWSCWNLGICSLTPLLSREW